MRSEKPPLIVIETSGRFVDQKTPRALQTHGGCDKINKTAEIGTEVRKEPEPDDFALVFQGDETLLCRPEAEDILLPRMKDGAFRDVQYAFSIDRSISERQTGHGRKGGPGMTFQQIRYFIAVAEIGSISETAKQMYVAQSSISSAIREIESYYGIQAFVRSAKGVSLTDDGRDLLSGLRIVMNQMEMLDRNYARTVTKSEGLSVAAQHHVCGFDAFQKVVAEETSNYYRFNYIECWTSDIYEYVKSGRADIGVFFVSRKFMKNIMMELEKRDLSFHPLHTEKLHVIFHEKSPLAALDTIRYQDLHAYPCLTYDYFGGENPILSSFIIPYTKKIGVGDRACAYSLMRSINAFVTGSSYRPQGPDYSDILVRPIDDGDEIVVGWICRNGFLLNEATQKFIAALQ